MAGKSEQDWRVATVGTAHPHRPALTDSVPVRTTICFPYCTASSQVMCWGQCQAPRVERFELDSSDVDKPRAQRGKGFGKFRDIPRFGFLL